MRPKIATCRHISRSVFYNEQKVELKHAERLTGSNLLRPLDRLTPAEIIHRFERRMQLNDRVCTSLHITLNFDPLDILTNQGMSEITRSYMTEIGFRHQPWVAWRHKDAGHPHCHIVATHVKWNGDPIELYNIGRNQSEKARLRIEREFSLITMEQKRTLLEQELRLGDKEAPPRLTYGEVPLARALSDIIGYVTERYHYTNLRELNAVLRLYNVEAYTGRPGSKLFEDRGLLYRALDEHGHYIGRPLKASFFEGKHTLNNLETKFVLNQALKLENIGHVECAAMYQLYNRPDDLNKVRRELEWDGVVLQIDKDRSGAIRQVMYVDVRKKVAVAGEEIAPYCGAQAIHELIERDKVRIATELRQEQTLRPRQRMRMHL